MYTERNRTYRSNLLHHCNTVFYLPCSMQGVHHVHSNGPMARSTCCLRIRRIGGDSYDDIDATSSDNFSVQQGSFDYLDSYLDTYGETYGAIAGRGQLVRNKDGSTTGSVSIAGLPADTFFGSHLHRKSCADDGGAHAQDPENCPLIDGSNSCAATFPGTELVLGATDPPMPRGPGICRLLHPAQRAGRPACRRPVDRHPRHPEQRRVGQRSQDALRRPGVRARHRRLHRVRHRRHHQRPR